MHRTGLYSSQKQNRNAWDAVMDKYEILQKNQLQYGLTQHISVVESTAKSAARKTLTGSSVEIGVELLSGSVSMKKHKDQKHAVEDVLSMLHGQVNEKHISTSISAAGQKLKVTIEELQVDDGFSTLRAEQYIAFRVQPELLDMDIMIPKLQFELRFWQVRSLASVKPHIIFERMIVDSNGFGCYV
jgi:hypothetical protein